MKGKALRLALALALAVAGQASDYGRIVEHPQPGKKHIFLIEDKHHYRPPRSVSSNPEEIAREQARGVSETHPIQRNIAYAIDELINQGYTLIAHEGEPFIGPLTEIDNEDTAENNLRVFIRKGNLSRHEVRMFERLPFEDKKRIAYNSFTKFTHGSSVAELVHDDAIMSIGVDSVTLIENAGFYFKKGADLLDTDATPFDFLRVAEAYKKADQRRISYAVNLLLNTMETLQVDRAILTFGQSHALDLTARLKDRGCSVTRFRPNGMPEKAKYGLPKHVDPAYVKMRMDKFGIKH